MYVRSRKTPYMYALYVCHMSYKQIFHCVDFVRRLYVCLVCLPIMIW